ncbi:hypothetical protein CORC01_08575 [Colletotrichum orchidophilum]|uniref:Uncharacterized protein n=1 Tax=Colletotrichum orchidophilum TaxID=1209926 RepID=A0A1G4B439_9PEZI|nr:uncharacterized protein CORC01_08575 [Colletotrichum orchidophilum]OHE96198.1 hypothetical protein CORC01_08575 [Colletotrichum orchidophilum]
MLVSLCSAVSHIFKLPASILVSLCALLLDWVGWLVALCLRQVEGIWGWHDSVSGHETVVPI